MRREQWTMPNGTVTEYEPIILIALPYAVLECNMKELLGTVPECTVIALSNTVPEWNLLALLYTVAECNVIAQMYAVQKSGIVLGRATLSANHRRELT